MLMITVTSDSAIVALRLDGQLAGSNARELARARSAVRFNRPDETVLFDLTGVTAIDDVGKEFLAQAHSNGDRLIAGAGTRAIIDEIVARSGTKYALYLTHVAAADPGGALR